MATDLMNLVEHIEKAGQVSAADANAIARRLYSDGIVTFQEGEHLFRLNNALHGKNAEWDGLFVMAIKDLVLTHQAPHNWVSEGEADWLITQITHDGIVSIGNEMDALLQILRYAEGAPSRLALFAFRAACARIVAEGRADAQDVERVRRALFAQASDGGTWVSASEAETLFETNDAIAFARNDASWNDFFARAIGNHLMARAHPAPQSQSDALARERWLQDTSVAPGRLIGSMAASFTSGDWFANVTHDAKKARAAQIAAMEAAQRDAETVNADETNWLVRRLGLDKKVSPAEKALLNFLKTEAPGFAHGLAVAA